MTKKLSLLLFFILMVLNGCGRFRFAGQMRSFMETSVVFPESMLVISDREVFFYKDSIRNPALVIYFDTTRCSICSIDRLYDKLPFVSKIDSLGLCDVKIVFSPTDEEYADVLFALERLRFPYPIYLDAKKEFRRKNKIPEDNKLHTFLLDQNRRPVFIGDPSSSQRLNEVFLDVLNEIK